MGTHRMPSIHPDQLKAEAAEAAELLKKLKACMNPEHNPSRYLRTHGGTHRGCSRGTRRGTHGVDIDTHMFVSLSIHILLYSLPRQGALIYSTLPPC